MHTLGFFGEPRLYTANDSFVVMLDHMLHTSLSADALINLHTVNAMLQ